MPTTHVALLRGINVGAANRVKMADLKLALASHTGARSIETYIQSGNILLDSELAESALAEAIELALAEEFAIQTFAVIRTIAELREIVDANPWPEAVAEPKKLQVTFYRDRRPDLEQLQARVAGREQLVAREREVYTLHPDGLARSKLALSLVPRAAPATSRNWNVTSALLELGSR